MIQVTYDNRSFMVNGHRIWLVSGALHYFRMPAALWRDHLMKARRGGLNCIETYIPWNYHEPLEGQWRFTGDCDVAEFVKQAGDLGMYVIIRPGPYICAEWDFGGLPAWLMAKANIQYRTHNAIYTHYYDKYFRQLLPQLADLQVTRGGNIIAIQNENEYFMTTQPDRQEYLSFITRLIRRAGFDIPVLTCNLLSSPKLDDTIECINGWQDVTVQAKKLRQMQPEAPLLATEFHCGWYDHWGGPHACKDARETARRALELTGAGVQINYYMYHGGTNFAFWGGRAPNGDYGFITTSYDYDAPIAEGGGLTRKYSVLRLVNMMASHMGYILAAASDVMAPATLTDTAVYACTGVNGDVTVVTNNGNDAIKSARVVLTDGRTLDVDLSHFGAVAVFSRASLTDTHVLDYSNLMPLGLFCSKMLVLHGVPGQHGVVSINGTEIALEVPTGNSPLRLEFQGLVLVVMASSLAERCWNLDGSLIIGPEFVGETMDDLALAPGTKQYYIFAPDGHLTTKRVRHNTRPARVHTPTLSSWHVRSVCTEPTDKSATFTRIDCPSDMASEGALQGYGWYRVSIDMPRATSKDIVLPCCADRATVFINGRGAGVWGRGPGAQRKPLHVKLQRGVNELTLLVDNLGRFNYGFALGERKGIWGDICSAVGVRLKAWRIKQTSAKDFSFSRRIVPRNQQFLVDHLQLQAPLVCENSFTVAQNMPVYMQFTALNHTMAIFCNDRQVGFFPQGGGGFGDVLLAGEIKKGSNNIRLLIWADVAPKDLSEAFHLYRLEDNLTAASEWRFRPWTLPNATVGNGSKGAPTWYLATFKSPKVDQPLFLAMAGANKGQIYLNSHNVGRFWSAGPQEHYYLPECWFREVNELLVFDETGSQPVSTKLQFKPLGPYAGE